MIKVHLIVTLMISTSVAGLSVLFSKEYAPFTGTLLDYGYISDVLHCLANCSTRKLCDAVVHSKETKECISLYNSFYIHDMFIVKERLNNSLQVWTPHGSSYYTDPGIQADWHNARDLCRSFGGYLVTIRSQKTLDFINGFKSVSADQYWIGASDEEKEGTFAWVNDEPWDFESFPSTEPNGDTVENCLLLFGDSKPAEEQGKFNDMMCSDEFRFICERNI